MSSHCVVLQHFLFTSFFALLTVSVASEKTPITYNDHVKPIFRQHCLKCHGDDKQKAGINLQIYANVLKGGSAGEVVIAGRSSESLLFQVITNPDDNKLIGSTCFTVIALREFLQTIWGLGKPFKRSLSCS